mgnify:CR=1 FL=1
MDLDNALANSHTHYQAAPTSAQTQAWQRVCLSQPTTKTTEKQRDEKAERGSKECYAHIAFVPPLDKNEMTKN